MYTVLYVDDEPDLLLLCREFLERSPEFRVIPFASAREALESPEIQDCDAIVSDYQMPEMDGITFLKAVREQFNDIPFILFTGRGREAIVIDAINNGADFYLQKGGDAKSQFAELQHKIRQAVARRQAESLLVESEKRLTDIINFLPDATFAIDREGKIIAWNHAIEEMTGIPATDMLGKGDHEYAIPFYGDRRTALIDMVFESDEVLSQRYTHISRERGILTGETSISPPDGRPRILMATARPLYDRQGAIAGAIESLRDISGMRAAEEALKASEEKYRLVVEHSLDAVYIHRNDRVLFANNRASELTGYTHDELMEIRLWDLVHPDDRAVLVERAKKRFSGESVAPDFVSRLLTKDGREKPCEFFVDLIVYQGEPAILGIARDITVRKETEDSLRASEARFRELAELLPQIIFETDRDLRITYVNRHARTVTGLTQDDLDRGYTAFDFITEKHHARAKESIGKIIRGEPIDHHEYEVSRRDGTRFTALIYAAPILHEGTFSGLRGVVVDVSDQKQAEEELRTAYDRLAAQEEELRRQYEELARSEEKLRATQASVDQASFGVLWLSPEGKIIYANAAESRMLGYTSDELLDMSVWDIDPSRNPALYAERWEQLRAAKVWQFETIHRTKDGRLYPVEVTGRYISIGEREFYYSFDHDITNRKRAEEALQQSEGQFRELADLLPQIIFETDKDLRITYTNLHTFTIIGLSQDDLMRRGYTPFDFLAPEDHERARENMGRIIRGETTDAHDYKIIRPDGTHITVLIYAAAIQRDGVFSGLRGVIVDITDQRRVEDALRESEERFQMALEASDDGLFDLDMVSGDAYFSPRYLGMLGYAPGELTASLETWGDLLHPDDRDYAFRVMDEYRNGKRGDHAIEFRLRTKDGGWKWVLSHGKITARDAGGRPQRMVGTHTDITGRKQAEQALRESEDKYRRILENLQDAYFHVDSEGKIVLVSPSAAHIFGYSSPDEMIGKPAASMYHDPHQRTRIFELLTRDGRVSDFTGEAHRRDGSAFYASISVQYLKDQEGKIIGTEAIVRDISGRKTMEHAIQEANRKLNLLNTITRHDVINQLTALQGYVQLACVKKTDPVILDFLHKIQEAADTIEHQIAFTSLYQELGVQEATLFSIEEVVGKASGTSVPVRFSGTCHGIQVMADPMLERVFFNLFENAIRHGKRVTKIVVRCEREPDGLLIIVEDDGVGIKPHEKEKIFTKGYGKNTGFGLFLVKEILAITGITIRETGAFGKGARFEMFVPKAACRLPDAVGKKG